MSFKNKICLFLPVLLVLFVSRTNAQTKGMQEIEVDLASGVFVSQQGIPFDVPFRIFGSVSGTLREVSVKYKIDPSEYKKWMRFPRKEKDSFSTPVTWTAIDEVPKDQKFRLTVGPLHPNVAYQFNYTILKTPPQAQREELKKTIFESINRFLENLKGLDDIEIAKQNNDLNRKLQLFVGAGTIVEADKKTPFKLNILDGPLKNTADEIIVNNLSIEDSKQRIESFSAAFDANRPAFRKFREILANINVNPSLLNDASKIIWQGPVTTTIPSLKDLKYSDLAKLLADPNQPWRDVIRGKMKIERAGLIPTTVPDISSYDILAIFFTNLIANTIKNTADENAFAEVGSDKLGMWFQAASDAFDYHEAIKIATKKREDLLAKFPDVLSDKFILFSVIFIDKSISDVVSQSNPYIGLDVGFSYVPGYSQLFLYEGVNFYFVPVNKDAPLARMRGLKNNLSKRLSIHFGLTQSLISIENKNYQPLTTAGSLLVGGGIRVSRIVRINYGTIFFYEKNANPLITKKDMKSMYCFSLTFDINVGKALGNFGTRLGIPKN